MAVVVMAAAGAAETGPRYSRDHGSWGRSAAMTSAAARQARDAAAADPRPAPVRGASALKIYQHRAPSTLQPVTVLS